MEFRFFIREGNANTSCRASPILSNIFNNISISWVDSTGPDFCGKWWRKKGRKKEMEKGVLLWGISSIAAAGACASRQKQWREHARVRPCEWRRQHVRAQTRLATRLCRLWCSQVQSVSLVVLRVLSPPTFRTRSLVAGSSSALPWMLPAFVGHDGILSLQTSTLLSWRKGLLPFYDYLLSPLKNTQSEIMWQFSLITRYFRESLKYSQVYWFSY